MTGEALEELKPAADDLLIFVDDTGHETFSGNQNFYGLGGCIVLGAGYQHIKERWLEVRKAINGDQNLPLHGSTMERKPENFKALAEFFLDRSIARIAVTTTKEVSLPIGMHPCVPVMGRLQEDIAIIANMLPCKGVWIIVESSQRADPILKACFSQLVPIGSALPIPVTKCLMPKSSNEPGLEIADFIVGAAGSQIQRQLRSQDGVSPDFRDVFCQLPPVGCRYSTVSNVDVDENGRVAVKSFLLSS
jgi:hypothetical protein